MLLFRAGGARRLAPLILLIFQVLANVGCNHYSRLNRPIPENFEARRLDGVTVSRAALQGKPWVLVLWAPG